MSDTNNDDDWFRITRRVIYADTDAMGVVYYGNYMRFLEVGRVELLRARGVPYTDIEARGLVMPVAEVNLRYLAPARYDDELEVAVKIDKVRHAQVKFVYELRRVGETDLIATGFSRHACVDAKAGKVTRFPDDLSAVLHAAAGTTP